MLIFWILLSIIGVVFLVALFDLTISNAGVGFTWEGAPGGPLKFRVRLKHWLPTYFRKSPTAAMAIGRKMLSANNRISAYMAAHEVGHMIRSREIGHIKYLIKYVTNKDFMVQEEKLAEDFALKYYLDPIFSIVARFQKGS